MKEEKRRDKGRRKIKKGNQTGAGCSVLQGDQTQVIYKFFAYLQKRGPCSLSNSDPVPEQKK